ncbi:MAG TPA: HAMP domain-containing sensor histidine kinase [Acidimicrobiales bacterium]|nr:HAMP domain-containing sensor histidine kinase [Acidimicrobiales bacterium]
MLRRLLLGYVGLTLAVLVAFGVPFGLLWSGKVRSDELGALSRTAVDAARLATSPLNHSLGIEDAKTDKVDDDGDAPVPGPPAITTADRATLTSRLDDFAGGDVTLVTLLSTSGGPIVSSGTARAGASRLLGRAQLLSTGAGATVTGSASLNGVGSGSGASLLFAAVPVPNTYERSNANDRNNPRENPPPAAGILLVAEPSSVVNDKVRDIALALLALGLAALALAAAAGFAVVRSLVRPLKRIELAVAALGRGDLAARAPTDTGPGELVQLAETVNVMAIQLGELITAQRAFVADASHQLRTPLTALRLRLENLRADAAPAPEEVDGVLGEVERLARLVTGLLALAHAEETRAIPEPVDVAEMLRNRETAWHSVAAEQGVVLRTGPLRPTRALVVQADLDQALDNLIDNALRATPEGGSVTLGLGEEAGRTVVHVIDEGLGMAAEERAHAFDRFWTGRADRGAGSGLGLAIVDQLVRNSGGAVELRDGPGGRGLDATILLRHA